MIKNSKKQILDPSSGLKSNVLKYIYPLQKLTVECIVEFPETTLRKISAEIKLILKQCCLFLNRKHCRTEFLFLLPLASAYDLQRTSSGQGFSRAKQSNQNPIILSNPWMKFLLLLHFGLITFLPLDGNIL